MRIKLVIVVIGQSGRTAREDAIVSVAHLMQQLSVNLSSLIIEARWSSSRGAQPAGATRCRRSHGSIASWGQNDSLDRDLKQACAQNQYGRPLRTPDQSHDRSLHARRAAILSHLEHEESGSHEKHHCAALAQPEVVQVGC